MLHFVAHRRWDAVNDAKEFAAQIGTRQNVFVAGEYRGEVLQKLYLGSIWMKRVNHGASRTSSTLFIIYQQLSTFFVFAISQTSRFIH